jgi:hypothetical protein
MKCRKPIQANSHSNHPSTPKSVMQIKSAPTRHCPMTPNIVWNSKTSPSQVSRHRLTHPSYSPLPSEAIGPARQPPESTWASPPTLKPPPPAPFLPSPMSHRTGEPHRPSGCPTQRPKHMHVWATGLEEAPLPVGPHHPRHCSGRARGDRAPRTPRTCHAYTLGRWAGPVLRGRGLNSGTTVHVFINL